jgi:hypothetical protein
MNHLNIAKKLSLIGRARIGLARRLRFAASEPNVPGNAASLQQKRL